MLVGERGVLFAWLEAYDVVVAMLGEAEIALSTQVKDGRDNVFFVFDGRITELCLFVLEVLLYNLKTGLGQLVRGQGKGTVLRVLQGPILSLYHTLCVLSSIL